MTLREQKQTMENSRKQTPNYITDSKKVTVGDLNEGEKIKYKV